MNTNHKLYQTVTVPALATAFLLLIPLIAMQFSNEVVWTLSDFILAGILLFSTGLTYKLITKKSENPAYRIAIGFALFAGLFLIWSNLAVGIIGSENNDINLWYYGIIVIGILGAFMGNFSAKGMERTLYAMAVVQAIITIIALLTDMDQLAGSSVLRILAVNGFFIMLFVASALLFRYAKQKQLSAN